MNEGSVLNAKSVAPPVQVGRGGGNGRTSQVDAGNKLIPPTRSGKTIGLDVAGTNAEINGSKEARQRTGAELIGGIWIEQGAESLMSGPVFELKLEADPLTTWKSAGL